MYGLRLDLQNGRAELCRCEDSRALQPFSLEQACTLVSRDQVVSLCRGRQVEEEGVGGVGCGMPPWDGLHQAGAAHFVQQASNLVSRKSLR